MADIVAEDDQEIAAPVNITESTAGTVAAPIAITASAVVAIEVPGS